MIDQSIAKEINKVVEEYFQQYPSLTIVPAKELMPAFISAGIFKKDHKNGMPIRKVLRQLDKDKQLELIPLVYAERNEKDVYWYFVPAGAETPKTPYKQQEKKPDSEREQKRYHSDEAYVVNLCDKVLGLKADRQKRFGFLLGDTHKDGYTRTSLPVDAFYEDLKLVVEYKEKLREKAPTKFDRPVKLTVSGVTRDEQRKIYNERKADVLPENGIDLVVISYSDFSCDEDDKIIRNEASDLKRMTATLKKYIRTEESTS